MDVYKTGKTPGHLATLQTLQLPYMIQVWVSKHCTQGGWLDTLDIDILFTIHIDIL